MGQRAALPARRRGSATGEKALAVAAANARGSSLPSRRRSSSRSDRSIRWPRRMSSRRRRRSLASSRCRWRHASSAICATTSSFTKGIRRSNRNIGTRYPGSTDDSATAKRRSCGRQSGAGGSTRSPHVRRAPLLSTPAAASSTISRARRPSFAPASRDAEATGAPREMRAGRPSVGRADIAGLHGRTSLAPNGSRKACCCRYSRFGAGECVTIAPNFCGPLLWGSRGVGTSLH